MVYYLVLTRFYRNLKRKPQGFFYLIKLEERRVLFNKKSYFFHKMLKAHQSSRLPLNYTCNDISVASKDGGDIKYTILFIHVHVFTCPCTSCFYSVDGFKEQTSERLTKAHFGTEKGTL